MRRTLAFNGPSNRYEWVNPPHLVFWPLFSIITVLAFVFMVTGFVVAVIVAVLKLVYALVTWPVLYLFGRV